MLKSRDVPPTAADFVMANWRGYLLFLGYFTILGTGVGVGVYFGWNCLIPVGCAFAGLLVGMLAQNFTQMRVTADAWQMTREVIDWEKVRQLIDEDDCSHRRLPNDDEPSGGDHQGAEQPPPL